jgi:hypothetical protein
MMWFRFLNGCVGGFLGAAAAGGSAGFGSGGFEFARFHLGEVDDGARHVVRVVGENVQRDVLHDLDDFRVIQSSAPGCVPVGVCDVAALKRHGAGELERSVGLVVRGRGAAGGEDVVLAQAGLAAEQRVRAEAIAAAVDLTDGEGDLFA